MLTLKNDIAWQLKVGGLVIELAANFPVKPKEMEKKIFRLVDQAFWEGKGVSAEDMEEQAKLETADLYADIT